VALAGAETATLAEALNARPAALCVLKAPGVFDPR